jgi:hypothetical protein
MVPSNTAATPLIFRGSPRRLKLLSALPEDNVLAFEPDQLLSNYVGTSSRSFKQKQTREGEVRDLRVRLAANTPPGLYKAVAKIKGKSVPIEIHVEERTRISVTPTLLAIAGNPGDKVNITTLFINRGNTTIEIPRTDAIGIYDDKGIETAFASTYRQDNDDVINLLGHFVGKLREGHGGLLKLRITNGYGALSPEERTAVEIEAQVPSKLKPGHHYHGVWRIASINYAIKLAVKK